MLYVATAICNKLLKTYCIYMCHYTYALLEAIKQNSSKLKSRSFKKTKHCRNIIRRVPMPCLSLVTLFGNRRHLHLSQQEPPSLESQVT